MKRTLLLLLAGVASACSGVRAAVVSDYRIAVPPEIVAQRIAAPLVIVATPADVPDRLAAPLVGLPGEQVELRRVRSFVTRDLARALGQYFSTVRVVDDDAAVPP